MSREYVRSESFDPRDAASERTSSSRQPGRSSGSRGQGPGSDPQDDARLTPERVPRFESERSVEPRKAYEFRGRTYTVRSSEIETLAELGKFRAVAIEDLEEFRYHGDEDRIRPDVANLIRQGLVAEKTVPHSETGPRRLLTLTKKGHQFLRATGTVPRNQATHYGFTKPRESSEKTFSEFAARNTALDIPTQARATIEAAATLEGQLIAAETELQGLKQMYADGNVRVRATQARVTELRQELEKNLTGPASAAPGAAVPTSAHTARGQSPFPSLRELPALGVSYADLYRNTKIQEAVFQTLTQEFELAKVQEVKETPSVKILDPPDVPEKKAFPPRLLIVLLGAAFFLAAGFAWLFGRQAWVEAEPSDPQVALVAEVFHSVRARLPWASSNGSDPSTASGKILNPYSGIKEDPRGRR